MDSEIAGKALTYSVIGIFCFGMIFGAMAVAKAIDAKREIRDDPRMAGLAKANIAMVLGITEIILWVLTIISRVRGS